jgi:hypothetical protein
VTVEDGGEDERRGCCCCSPNADFKPCDISFHFFLCFVLVVREKGNVMVCVSVHYRLLQAFSPVKDRD